jgi:hypothetical protein
MTITFTIPYLFLRAILAELRRHPYHVAVGQAGLNTLPTGDIEVLARSFRCVHEGAVRQSRDNASFRYEMGFVPWTFQGPEIWHTAALAARFAGNLPDTPTCLILFGSGTEVGQVTGMCTVGDQIAPVHNLRVVGAGMHRLAAVDFRAASCGTPWPSAAERWSRVIGALGGQGVWQRLVALHVCIVGLERIGSLVATTLAQQGVRTLTVIDPDTLEEWNLDAMDAVTTQDLGRLKVEAVAEHLQQRFPYTCITAIPRSIVSAEARLAARRADILICCVDDDAARLYTGGLACCYARPLLDVGTGIFHDQAPRYPVHPEQPAPIHGALPHRALGADVRLIVPGDGCLLCWGGVAQLREAIQRWRTGQPRRPWHVERAGSLRSLNAMAAHLGLRLLEDLVAGRLTRSVWLRFETDAHGVPTLRHLPARRRPTCALCTRQGLGDLFGR